jgi:HK97 family phage portal protein
MGWFDFLRKRDATSESTQQIAPDTDIVDDVLLQALLNGETITREKVMTLPSVNGAVDFISNAIACMPVKLYKYKDGKVEEIEKDDRVKMLNGDTGDTLDAFQMKKAMVSDFLLGKGGYCYIRRNRNDVTGLFYVEDRYITIMKVYEPIFKQYEIVVGGFERGKEKEYGTYKPWQFIKLLRNTKDGASGVGLTVEVSKALETAYQTLLYQLGMVSTGGNKKGFLKSQRKLAQDEINTLKKAWANLYANNNENVVVLNNGLEFQEASNSAVETQLNESKKTLQDEINSLFHLYPDDFERTFKEAIYPIVKAFETALNRDLLLEKEKKNHFFEFDVKEIVRVSIKERYEAYKLAKETGFMTLNEIRRRENMPFIEGLDVVNVGLGAVLYDTNKHIYYTPNTDTIGDIGDGGSNESEEQKEAELKKTQDMLIGHELAKEFDESGNSSDA